KNFTAIMKNAPKSLYNASFGDIANIYTAGRAAFGTYPGRLRVGLAEKAKEVAEATEVMPIPAGPVETAKLHLGSGQQYGVYAETANLDLAKEFLKHLTTGENAVEFALTVPGHLLPALKSTRQIMIDKINSATEGYLKVHKDWLMTFIDN